MKCGLTNTKYNLMPFQDTVEDPVTMICSNAVKKEKNPSIEDCFQN
jgi:hypothetical protein